MHRTGSIIQTLGILIFQNYFSSSSIFGFFSEIIPIILALCANTVNLRPPATGCDNAIFSNLVNMLFLLYHNKLLQYDKWIFIFMGALMEMVNGRGKEEQKINNLQLRATEAQYRHKYKHKYKYK